MPQQEPVCSGAAEGTHMFIVALCWLSVSRPSFYSHGNAPGVVMAAGNTGEYLDASADTTCTWMSRDGGANWEDVADYAAIYEFGDHGSIILTARYQVICSKPPAPVMPLRAVNMTATRIERAFRHQCYVDPAVVLMKALTLLFTSSSVDNSSVCSAYCPYSKQHVGQRKTVHALLCTALPCQTCQLNHILGCSPLCMQFWPLLTLSKHCLWLLSPVCRDPCFSLIATCLTAQPCACNSLPRLTTSKQHPWQLNHACCLPAE